MKKVSVFAISIILLLSFSACKKSGDTNFSGSSSVIAPNGSSHGASGGEIPKEEADSLSLISSIVFKDEDFKPSEVISGHPDAVLRESDEFLYYPEGYGEGTSGGRGASAEDIYECASGSEILAALETIKQKQALSPSTRSIILVTDAITEENTLPTATNTVNYQIIVNSVNNLSVLGANENAVFDGVGMNFKTCDNVIVQNLTIHHPSKTLKNEKDCLEFNRCNNVWVDHCELYNDYPANSSEKDYYDGLIDVKNQSSRVTISYNYLHDAFKTSLIGSGPDDLYDDRAVTYHHNVFENCNSRIPLIRSGYAHVYDNYYKNCLSRCVNTRIGAKVFVEYNVFENSKRPITDLTDGDPDEGFYNAENNLYLNSSDCDGKNCDYTPSYRYHFEDTTNLKESLLSNVGTNKIDIDKCKAEAPVYEKYEISNSVKAEEYIKCIDNVTLDGDCAQKILYAAEFLSSLSYDEYISVSQKERLFSAIEEYVALLAADFDSRANVVDINGLFSENASLAYKLLEEYNGINEAIKAKIASYGSLAAAIGYYEDNFEKLFNAQISEMKDVRPLDRAAIYDLDYLSSIRPDLGLSTEELTSGEIKMDLTDATVGRTSGVTAVGGIAVGTSTDIREVDVTYGSTTYYKAVFISGYGNPGSKCLQFDVFVKSDVTVILSSESGKAKVLITDPDRNIIRSFEAIEGIETYTIQDLPVGEYRLFTDIPSGEITGSKLYIYEFIITN